MKVKQHQACCTPEYVIYVNIWDSGLWLIYLDTIESLIILENKDNNIYSLRRSDSSYAFSGCGPSALVIQPDISGQTISWIFPYVCAIWS